MAAKKITDMTIDDIKALIIEMVDEKLRSGWQLSKPARSVEEILAAMDSLRWTPPSRSPTTTELLQEDRSC